jgi:hypothetical protein
VTRTIRSVRDEDLRWRVCQRRRWSRFRNRAIDDPAPNPGLNARLVRFWFSDQEGVREVAPIRLLRLLTRRPRRWQTSQPYPSVVSDRPGRALSAQEFEGFVVEHRPQMLRPDEEG